jgi:hypothetical protein
MSNRPRDRQISPQSSQTEPNVSEEMSRAMANVFTVGLAWSLVGLLDRPSRPAKNNSSA